MNLLWLFRDVSGEGVSLCRLAWACANVLVNTGRGSSIAASQRATTLAVDGIEAVFVAGKSFLPVTTF